jgi:hypothetical protein
MKSREGRTRRIRRYVVTTTVTLFLAVWSFVYAEMRTGDDPVLGSGTAVATATQSTETTTSSSSSASSSDDDSSSSTDSSSDDSSGSTSSDSTTSAPSAVTTQQS